MSREFVEDDEWGPRESYSESERKAASERQFGPTSPGGEPAPPRDYTRVFEENADLRRRLQEAIAHDRQPYPTAEAYERVCAVLAEAREQIAQLEEALGKAYEWAAKYPLQGDGSVPDCSAATKVYLLAEAALRQSGSGGKV